MKKIILILFFTSLMLAQEKNILNYSFQEGSVALSNTSNLRINTIIGKTVIGVAGTDSYILRSSSIPVFTQREATGIQPERNNTLPKVYSLDQNYPNPFNPVTRISYSIPKEGHVTLSVYNMLGEKVQQLVNESMSPGTYTVDWNAAGFTSGIYLYTIKSGNYTESKKLILLR